MSHLNEYLSEKRAAVLARSAAIEAGTVQAARLKASVRAEGRSGVRRLRIREHQVISDSPPDFAGYNLGPSSPELQLGVLGTCVTHIFLIPGGRAPGAAGEPRSRGHGRHRPARRQARP